MSRTLVIPTPADILLFVFGVGIAAIFGGFDAALIVLALLLLFTLFLNVYENWMYRAPPPEEWEEWEPPG